MFLPSRFTLNSAPRNSILQFDADARNWRICCQCEALNSHAGVDPGNQRCAVRSSLVFLIESFLVAADGRRSNSVPSHYDDDDGYVIRWWRAMIPSNLLVPIALERQVLTQSVIAAF